MAQAEIEGSVTPEEIVKYAKDVHAQKGFLPEYPDNSMEELAKSGEVAFFYGLCPEGHVDEERLRVFGTKDSAHPPFMWAQWPLGPKYLSEDNVLKKLEPKTVCIPKIASDVGVFESYMVERSFHALQRDLKFGTQRLNRVIGAGNPYRGVPGVYNVFVTYVKTEKIKQHSNLMVNS